MRIIAGSMIVHCKAGLSSPRCINIITIYAALIIVKIMKIWFNKIVPKNFVSIKYCGLIIPSTTSTAVTTKSIQKTFQIHQLLFDSEDITKI